MKATGFIYPIEPEQIYKGAGAVLALGLVVGRASGWLLDEFREIFHVKSYYEKQEERIRNLQYNKT
jgi:hypothetical protein